MSIKRLPRGLTPSPAREHDISREEIFDVLSNRRRQCVVHYLKRHQDDDPVALGDLVEYVAAWEADVPIDDLDPVRRKRVYNALRQTHLPKLEDAGLIAWDQDRNRIELTPAIRDARLYLEHVPNDDIPWSLVYLALSAIAAVLTAATWYGAPLFGGNSGLTIGVIVLGMFATTGIVHRIKARSNRIPADGRFEPPDQ